MRTNRLLLILPLCGLALCGCATPVPPPYAPVEVSLPKLPPPADVMVERAANFRARILEFFQARQRNSSSE